jgi:hypothetical protein
MTTYSDNLRLTLIGTGEQAGVWGTTTNVNLGTLLEAAIAGLITVDVGSTTYPLSAYDGVTDESRQAVIVFTGSPGGTATIYLPPATKTYIFKNGTDEILVISNSQGTTAPANTTPSGGTTVAIPVGKTTLLATDGNDVQGGVDYIADDLSVLGDGTFSGNGAFGGTGSLKLPTGTTLQRAGTGIRYNTTTGTYEGYNINTATWGEIGGGGGATGGGLNKAFFENQTEITASYTITTGYNAITAGPVTLVPLDFTGSITATTLTVPVGGVTTGILYVGAVLTGTGVAVGTTITALGTGTGSDGTYTVSPSQSVGSTNITSVTTVTVPVGSNWTVTG